MQVRLRRHRLNHFLVRLSFDLSCSSVSWSLLSHLFHFQNQPLARRNARGSIGVDTAYLDRQREEKRFADAQILQEKQEGKLLRLCVV